MSAAPIFHLLGDSFTPRVNGAGGPGYGRKTATTVFPAVNANAGAIGGSSIDFDDGTNYTQYGLSYNGVGNWPSTVEFSLLLRISFANLSASDHGLFYCGAGGRPDFDSIGLWVNSTNFVLRMVNSLGQVGINSVTFAHGGLSNNTFYDVGIKGTGETTTNGWGIWLNGTGLGTTTSTRTWYNPLETPPTARLSIHREMALGWGGNNINNTRFKLNEMAAWNSLVDFTGNFTLTSGEAALNGSSRTAFLQSTPSDGAECVSSPAGNTLKYCLGEW